MVTPLLIALSETINTFIHLSLTLSLLFLIISYAIGILQRLIPPTTIEALLAGGKIRSYLFALLLAAITPFCSCSTVPMLRGLLQARAGFGPTLLFLFTSPLINPVVLGLLFYTFGLKLTLLYLIVALCVSTTAGILLEKLNFARFIRPTVASSARSKKSCSSDQTHLQAPDSAQIQTERDDAQCCSTATSDASPCCPSAPSTGRFSGVMRETWRSFCDLFPYLLLGVTIGALIHGFMPTQFLQQYAGNENPFAIPFSAIIGIPLYIRIEAIIPLASSLLTKGMGAGPVMALIIGSAGASLTELILLRSLFRTPLIIAFVAVVLSMALIAGYLTHFLY